MADLMRCPNCRGAKQVMKLGGMFGNCNLCSGKGEVSPDSVPKPVAVVQSLPMTSELINATADCIPPSTVEEDIKVDGKKALYKRKTSLSR
jgi:hypothetical protein